MGADAPLPPSLGAELTGVQAALLRRRCAAWTPFAWVPRRSVSPGSLRHLTGGGGLTGWGGGEPPRRYAANMHSRCSELTELVEAGSRQVVGALRVASAEGLSVRQMTELLGAAPRQRNQIASAVTSLIGAVDAAAEKAADDGSLTLGLSCATWLAHNLHISSSAAHAQVRLARQLPSLPATAAAFERGELSGQHASVVARSVERGARGGGGPGQAERLALGGGGGGGPP